jgi:hypothetical protein
MLFFYIFLLFLLALLTYIFVHRKALANQIHNKVLGLDENRFEDSFSYSSENRWNGWLSESNKGERTEWKNLIARYRSNPDDMLIRRALVDKLQEHRLKNKNARRA